MSGFMALVVSVFRLAAFRVAFRVSRQVVHLGINDCWEVRICCCVPYKVWV